MSDCRCAEIHRIDSSKEGGPSDLEVYRYIYGHLRWLADHSEGWESLYGCPETGLLWKKYLSPSEGFSDGWPIVEQISPEEAKATFGWKRPRNKRLAAIRAAPTGAQVFVDKSRRRAAEFGIEIDWSNDSGWWQSLRRRGIKREEIEL